MFPIYEIPPKTQEQNIYQKQNNLLIVSNTITLGFLLSCILDIQLVPLRYPNHPIEYDKKVE